MISTRTHGIIDYLSAATLAAAPRLMGWDPPLRRAMDAAALGSVAYAHLTDYELGATPLLSMRSHLAIDAAEGAAFLAAAALLGREPPAVRLSLAAYGVFALAAAALTDRQTAAERRTGGRRMRTGAWVMDSGPDEAQDDVHKARNEAWGETMDTNWTGGRDRHANPVGESEWRRARGPEFARHIAEVGRDQGEADADSRDAVAGRDWRQARYGAAGENRLNRAFAEAGTRAPVDRREIRRVPYADARQGYLHGQGI